MCITNSLVEDTLKEIRNIESNGVSSLKDSELCELIAKAHTIQKEFEEISKVIKKEAVNRQINETYYVPSIQKKVYLTEGKVLESYDNEAIYKELSVDTLIRVSKLVKSSFEILTPEEKEIVAKYTSVSSGSPYISVLKMNKKELKEYEFNGRG